jgi:transcriptional regulator with XRE-family HTH domain
MKNITFNNVCGMRLLEERKRLGFTQQEIAGLIGVQLTMPGRYERGQAAPGGDVLVAFAAIGGDVQYVLTGQRSSSQMTPDEKKLLAGFRKLDLRGQISMLGMLDVLGISLKEGAKNISTPHTDSQLLGKTKAKRIVQDVRHVVDDFKKGGSKTLKKKLTN